MRSVPPASRSSDSASGMWGIGCVQTRHHSHITRSPKTASPALIKYFIILDTDSSPLRSIFIISLNKIKVKEILYCAKIGSNGG